MWSKQKGWCVHWPFCLFKGLNTHHFYIPEGCIQCSCAAIISRNHILLNYFKPRRLEAMCG